jgi:hypothetical protein
MHESPNRCMQQTYHGLSTLDCPPLTARGLLNYYHREAA